MTHDEIQADLSLYALGSLDAEEGQAIAQHLAAGCETCERELRAWSEVVGLVPLEAPAQAPPDLKAKLLARVHGEASSAMPARPAAAAVALLAFATYREIGWRAERGRQQEERNRQAQALASLQRELEAARGDL